MTVILALYSLTAHFRPLVLLFCLLAIILDLYPICLPGSVKWTPSVICYLWSLRSLGYSDTSILITLSCLAMFFSANNWNIKSVRWYRYFISLGMFQLALAGCCFVNDVYPGHSVILQRALLIVCFEACNFVLYMGVQWSLGQLRQAWHSLSTRTLIPMMVSVAVLTLVSQYETALSAMLPAAALLVCFIVMSRQYYSAVQSSIEANKKYQLIANNTDDLVLVIDPNGQITFASPSHARLFHVSLEDITGREVFDFIEEHGEDLRKAIAAKPSVTSLHELLFQFGDTSIPTETQVSPVFREDGELDGFIVVSRDISERLRQQKYLIQTEKLAVAGQLAAGIAHEIRNPLTSVMGFLQLLRQEFDAVSPEAFRVVWSELSRISEITGQLLLLAKPEPSLFVDFDLKLIIRDTITLLEGQAHKDNVFFVANLEETVYIHCNPNQLKQVFVNLFKNSIEAMEGNGGNIYVKMSLSGNEVRVEIQDEGPGIPQHLIQSLGQPFYTTKEKGTGLGLMVVHNIVKEHKGSIRFDSDGSKGTHVMLTFPIVETSSHSQAVHGERSSTL